MNASNILDMVDTSPKPKQTETEQTEATDAVEVFDKQEKALLKRVLKLYRKPAGTLTPDEYQKLGALLSLKGS